MSSYRIVLPLFIAMSISTLVVVYHYISHRQIIHATVHMVQGTITKQSAGIRPSAKMMTDKVGIAANVTLVAGFLIRNLVGGRGISARSKDYEIVTGYTIGLGGKEFHIIKRWGEPFEDSAVYTVYYIKTRAVSMIVAAEA
jgi:hypothetical protein